MRLEDWEYLATTIALFCFAVLALVMAAAVVVKLLR